MSHWLRANKICLNTKKTEQVIFRSKQKIVTKKQLTTNVRYLGVIDQHLNWDRHIKTILPKLSCAIGMLAKIRYYVPKEILLNVYHAIFNSHLTYGSQVWGQANNEQMKKLGILQNKALRIIDFKPPRESTNKLYIDSKILKHKDQIMISNCLLAFSYLKGLLPSSFQKFLTPASETHEHDTKSTKLKF